ncbi:virulence-associated E family protein [Sporosarcina gallistercoris]|uniref:VapE domain-containing protein n=1 Tax=Sporosarcina gallistercoris TaxID=2762245 RepID=UPI003D299122
MSTTFDIDIVAKNDGKINELKYDRAISISVGHSRKSTTWPIEKLRWSQLVDRISKPIRTHESLTTFLSSSKREQDELKDVGGFVAGQLLDNRRKANNVLGRDVLTLDLDNLQKNDLSTVFENLNTLGCAYAIYSTRKHKPTSPRLRVLIPLEVTTSPDQYEPAARKAAEHIGIEFADPTTFEASRLMYWPSCSADSEFLFHYEDKPLLDINEMLDLYKDWTDWNEWPRVPGSDSSHSKLIAKQGDPTAKKGAVGMFCKAYDIHAAIEKFIPEQYSALGDGRYTYAGGSTAGGAVVYENGMFLYSHHATDPCSGRLVNAFDLIRLHKFNDLDDEARADTPINKLPSYTAMTELTYGDPLAKRKQIEEDFGGDPTLQETNTDWLDKLEYDAKAKKFKSTAFNVKWILKHDPKLAGKFAHDAFSYKDILLGSVPWRKIQKPGAIEDADDAGLRNYLSEVYGITGKSLIEDAMTETLLQNEFHPVREYLNGLSWDGIDRVDRLFIDYLGAEDTELTRAMTRKMMAGAVARVLRPGCKFDYVLMLVGQQGIGKSSFISLLGGEWFTDSLEDVRGKDAYEQIQGSWIIELGELAALRKADVEAVKRFVSTQTDKFRQAYARRSREFPRQCIFIASTNVDDPLKDQTGNRRFWPVQVGVNPIDLAARDDFPRDLVWAEAVELYKQGEKLTLPKHLEEQAKVLQGEYTEESSFAGLIRGKLDEPWVEEPFEEEGAGAIKDQVCAMQIWCEVLKFPKEKFNAAKAREINNILKNTPGWRVYPKNNGRMVLGDYGKQTVYERWTDGQT